MKRYTVVIEQTYKYQHRMKYIAEMNSFIEEDCDCLGYAENVKYPYGWIKEYGTPPHPHLDIYVITDKEYELGDEEEVNIIGVYWRSDGDHKLVGVLTDRNISDFSELTETEKEDLHRLYMNKYEGEDWYGREKAGEVIYNFFKEYVKKDSK